MCHNVGQQWWENSAYKGTQTKVYICTCTGMCLVSVCVGNLLKNVLIYNTEENIML